MDAWFTSHYVFAADQVTAALGRLVPLGAAHVLDVGCGDGIMALGVCHGGAGRVSGVDVTDAFLNLPEQARRALGNKPLPAGLRFRQIEPDRPLPFDAATFDAAYSWSVFEHVGDVSTLLNEIFRVLKPGAGFYLQIEPLFHSPYGAHLKRLVDEPWGHLVDEADFLARAARASDRLADEEKDVLYQRNAFEDVKRYLLSEYGTLNRITVDRLTAAVNITGFEVVNRVTGEVRDVPIPPGLLGRYDERDLRTNEIQLELRKPR